MEKRAKVGSLFEELDEIPILQFDKIVLGDPNQFQLSKSNLDELHVNNTNVPNLVKLILILIYFI